MPWEPLASADLEVGTCNLFIPLQASVSVKRLGNFLRNTELNPKMIDWVPVRESKLLMLLCGGGLHLHFFFQERKMMSSK